MSRKIFKFPLDFKSSQNIQIPIQHTILAVKNQNDCAVIYANVNTDAPLIEKEILMFATGESLPDLWMKKYIDSVVFKNGALVYHFFY